MLRISKTILVSILLIIGFIGTTSASVVLVTDRTSFAGTDFFDWGQLAGNFSNQVTSDGGLGATLTTPFTSPDLPFGPRAGLFVFTQNVDWFTNFNAGDRLTGSANNASTDAKLTIDFANPISGAGAQISTNWIVSYFSAQIDAYNSAGSLLGSVMEEGVSTGAG
ncbi:MAG: hypothetical protein L3J50_07275, partial [Emcibacter sp.]|nr:hypothetical protein [Emcibacter sp.]